MTLEPDITFNLHDRRKIGVALAGKSDGYPIFHFHGSSSSRREVKILDREAASAGVRLIGLDRPGIGLSDFKDNYHMLDWPDDVAEVAGLMGIERFAVEGVSDGGPYAMACAYKIPDRLTACGLISTVPPTEFLMKAGPAWMRAVWWFGGHFPGLFGSYLNITVSDSPTSPAMQEKQLLRYSSWLCEADKKLLRDPGIRANTAEALAESRRKGVKGIHAEALRGMQPWGFKAGEITFEKVFLWHGEKDGIMPVAPARLFARALPHCTATFYPEDGHFSVMVDHSREIFQALVK